MTLTPGTRLGPYEIVGPLGSGGMGEVYRAHDSRLHRDVAVKVLPPGVADNPTRRARFQREGQAISQLSHPNICTIFDVGEQDGVAFLVMEFVDGESLEARLRSGPLALPAALRAAVEIAAALDAAHARGVVHRDLKPANVMMAGSGIKLLDFGVAKLLEGSAAAQAARAFASTESLTAEHNVVGTLTYMAPEQLEGRDVDARTDIYAFGALLSEMVTGKKSFADARAAVEPAALDHIVRRALARDPDERWQTARDLMLELQWLLENLSRQSPLPRSPRFARLSRAIVFVALAAVLTMAAFLVWRLRPSTPSPRDEPLTVFTIAAPAGTHLAPGFGRLALSPDGRTIAFMAGPEGESPRIWVRRLDSATPHALLGTEGGNSPFWSPDGRSIGFYARDNSRIMRVEVAGGQPTPVTELAAAPWLSFTASAFWGPDDAIVFIQAHGLFRVNASGGTPVVIAERPAGNENEFLLPNALPDGRFLYLTKRNYQEAETLIQGPAGVEGSLATVRSNAVPASGYLIFRKDQSLIAQPFDHITRRLGSQSILLAEAVQYNPANGRTSFTASGDVLAYRSDVPRAWIWKDRDGRSVASISEAMHAWNPAIAPDGSGRVAFDRFNPATWTFEIVTIDDRGRTQLLPHVAKARFPVWSPDGRWIASWTPGQTGAEFHRTLSDGTGRDERLYQHERILPLDWTRDDHLVFQTGDPGDIWALDLSGGKTPVQITATPERETTARVSPDGRWMAYTSNQSGQDDIWLQPFPAGPGRKISLHGGSDPSWRADGQELYYLAPDGMLMLVRLEWSRDVAVSPPVPLFRIAAGNLGVHKYAVTADGQRFLVSEPVQTDDTITVIVHWTSLVKQ